MDKDTIFALLGILAALGYAVWKIKISKLTLAQRNKVFPLSTEPLQQDAVVKDFVEIVRDEKRMEDAVVDDFLDIVRKEKLIAEEELTAKVSAYKDKIERQVKNDELLKARLEKFAKDNQLDAALIKLWKEIQNYPRWSERQGDWSECELNKLGIDRPISQESKYPDTETVRFTYKNRNYSIASKEWRGEEDVYVDIHLHENDVEVFAIGSSIIYNDYVNDYRPFSVKALKKHGDWASMLIQLSFKLDFHSEQSSADNRALRAANIRNHFIE